MESEKLGKQSKNRPIESILAMVLGGLILYLIFHLQWILIVSLTIGLLGLLSKRFSNIIHLLWTKTTKAIGAVNAYLLLSLIFIIILIPIAFVYRLFKKDSSFFKDKKASSTFTSRNTWIKAEDLKNPW